LEVEAPEPVAEDALVPGSIAPVTIGTSAEQTRSTHNRWQREVMMAGKRTHIEPKGDDRYIRRDSKGRITESDDVGRSLAKDVKKAAKTKVKPGYGDKGDQPRKK
jgi:hypothetical protein